MSDQPNFTSNQGVVLSVGMLSGIDRTEMVMPMCLDLADPTPGGLCNDAVQSFVNNALTQLTNCFQEDCFITHVAAEGMDDGFVPSRLDFSTTAYQGQRPGAVLPSNVGLLLVFYEDPADNTGTRMRVGKTTIPGQSKLDYLSDQVVSDLVTAGDTFATLVQSGFDSNFFEGQKWYRVLAAPKPRGHSLPIKRTLTGMCRGYCATQRRRMVPRY